VTDQTQTLDIAAWNRVRWPRTAPIPLSLGSQVAVADLRERAVARLRLP